jgi:hypothetical protein
MIILKSTLDAWGAGRRETTTMEPTITQNSALYLAQQKLSTGRIARFDWMRHASSKQSADVRGVVGGRRAHSRIHRGNGR